MLLHRLCAEKLKEGKVKGEPTRRVEKKIGIQYIQEGKGGKKIAILCCIKPRQNETEELLGNSF